MRSNKLFLLKDRQKSNTFNYLDPTVIVRLHSIISDKDIFTLCNVVDYKVKYESETLLSMKLPKSMLESLQKLNLTKLYSISEKWCNSKEVKLYNWTIDRCHDHLVCLLDIANNPNPITKIYLQIFPDSEVVGEPIIEHKLVANS